MLGDNTCGQLGLGDRQARRESVFLTLGAKSKRVSAGGSSASAIEEDGGLVCWGDGRDGQLGAVALSAGFSSTPLRIATETDWLEVSVGASHVCGLRAHGDLYCWGKSGSGQIGIAPTPPSRVVTPTRVGTAGDYTSVVCGGDATCALADAGRLECWGDNSRGQLGLFAPVQRVFVPTRVAEGTTWSTIALGPESACAVQSDGSLWCWGSNTRGQLGVGDRDSRRGPALAPVGAGWASIAVGGYHACATDHDGATWCTGRNDTGALGVSDTRDRETFTRQIP